MQDAPGRCAILSARVPPEGGDTGNGDMRPAARRMRRGARTASASLDRALAAHPGIRVHPEPLDLPVTVS
ncbi:MAG: hypothetical protein IT532_18925 [Burkholderiales bacterium]|nr:hypothetical protein [Burkholderiales bacterium]